MAPLPHFLRNLIIYHPPLTPTVSARQIFSFSRIIYFGINGPLSHFGLDGKDSGDIELKVRQAGGVYDEDNRASGCRRADSILTHTDAHGGERR